MKKLLDNNRQWAEKCLKKDPEYFRRNAEEQKPKCLWFGCSDSRVVPNLILGLEPGEIFVYRTIANLFPKNDLTCLAVLQFAVEALGVEHIIVCGHTNCGGMGITELEHVKEWIAQVPPAEEGWSREETNVREQVKNIMDTDVFKNASQKLHIYGWVYDLNTGLIKDLAVM